MSSTLVAPWRAGESGNPRGLQRNYRVAIRKCRIASPLMAQRLIDCANDPNAPWASRVQAASAVLDRAWGKAPERIELGGDSSQPMLLIRIVDPDGEAAETITLGAVEPQQNDGFTLKLGAGK